MADKRTRSEHFLWQQQRLREQSDDKLRKGIAHDREFTQNTRKQSRPAPAPLTQEDYEFKASAIMLLVKMAAWGFLNYFIVYFFYLFSGYNPVAALFGIIVVVGWWILRRRRRRNRY